MQIERYQLNPELWKYTDDMNFSSTGNSFDVAIFIAYLVKFFEKIFALSQYS